MHGATIKMVDYSWNVMAHGDAREEKWRGIWRMEWVASTLHTTTEHGVSSITTADAHTPAARSRLNWRPRRFKWTRLFRRKTNSGFCVCAITFQLASTVRHATDNILRHMRSTCWITKPTDTHSKYSVLTALPRRKWLRERASTLNTILRILLLVFDTNYGCRFIRQPIIFLGAFKCTEHLTKRCHRTEAQHRPEFLQCKSPVDCKVQVSSFNVTVIICSVEHWATASERSSNRQRAACEPIGVDHWAFSATGLGCSEVSASQRSGDLTFWHQSFTFKF
jgi:hypothetical protein